MSHSLGLGFLLFFPFRSFLVGSGCAQCLSSGVNGDLDRCQSGNDTAYSCIVSYGNLIVVFNRGPLKVGAVAVHLLLVLHQVGSIGSALVRFSENRKGAAALVVNKVQSSFILLVAG